MEKLYPLKFEPIFKSNAWGGSRLRPFFGKPTSTEPTGEAWVLSDVDGSPSVVANGALAGKTLRELLATDAKRILGIVSLSRGRFPVLLKFLDAREKLSVQVHPTDAQAHAKKPGQLGKTEAWVVLESDAEKSLLYAGFRPGVTAESFRAAMTAKTVPDTLHQYTPKVGDCVFLEAGTVHAIGEHLFLFEVQQTSDITYRLYDWDRLPARELHIEEGLACSNFAMGPCNPVVPVRDGSRDRLVSCDYFQLHHRQFDRPTQVNTAIGECTILVVLDTDGQTELEYVGGREKFHTGDVFLLPAALGPCKIFPAGGPVRLLEIGLV
jgi:mannose-6-phosphate isomerase